MNIQQFITKFNPTYSQYLRMKLKETKNFSEDEIIKGALQKVDEIFLTRGKRVRPYTLYLMYKSAGGGDENIMMACIASELQHAFALVHDDIIDKGDIRHGVKTIQEYVNEELNARGFTGDTMHQANAHAMLIGDLMLLWSSEAMNLVEHQNKPRLMFLFLEMARKSVTGELLDVSIQARQNVPDDELNRRDLLKTAADTFINPMLIGASLADKEQEYESFCNKFGALMGEVFQIQDDILDILGEEGTPEYSDIKEHQHTFLTQYILKSGTEEEKRILQKFFAREGSEKEVEQAVLQILSKSKVIDFAKQEAAARLATAKQELSAARFTKEHEDLWLDVIGFFEKRFV
jgi:geranylgeranyl diphosphate synthase type I